MNADTQVLNAESDEDYVDVAAEIFAMLADPTRVRLILAMKDGEMSVNHLADIVDKTPAAASQHLAKLRLARMVSTRRDGTRVFYKLENDHAVGLVIEAIHQAEHSLGRTPRHHHSS